MPKDLNSQQTGVKRSADVNDVRPTPIRGMNTFPQNYVHPTTHSFADVDPFMIMNVVRHDNIPIRCGHDIHSYQLSSPMLSDMVMHKLFVNVPMKAIYPRNWDLMLVPPTQGDDIPDDNRFIVGNLLSSLRSILESIKTLPDPVASASHTLDDVLRSRIRFYLRFLFTLESVFSSGSLFSRMNIHFEQFFEARKAPSNPVQPGYTSYNFDQFFDLVLTSSTGSFALADVLRTTIFRIIFESGTSYLYTASQLNSIDQTSSSIITTSAALIELLRNNEFEVFGGDLSTLELRLRNCFSSLRCFIIPPIVDGDYVKFNLEYIPAYQLACSQFITDEHVDSIYSSKMYTRQMQSLLFGPDANLPTFTYNGDEFLYDVFSGKVFDSFFDTLVNSMSEFIEDDDIDTLDSKLYSPLTVLQINLFTARKSLKYGDYFTGAKPKPLAVGDVNAPVVGNQVSAVDVTRSISKQRFLNAVNIAGRKIGNYLTALWGGSLPEAPDDIPLFLASEQFSIGKQEIENTGEAQSSSSAQNTVTTQLRSTNSKYLMNAQFDQPSILIGLVYFDAPRIYSRTFTRFAFHYDRYDDFIPQMQYVGDQDIKGLELGLTTSENYGYTLRNMEYKQQYSFASGGFIKFLPSWIFIGDNDQGNPLPPNGKISPEFIRSTNFEFDRFYTSLTGLSLASRFHFIVKHVNLVRPDRQMAYRPEILQ